MINIILISHDYYLAQAITKYFLKMMPINNQVVKLFFSGGLDRETLGTNPNEIKNIIKTNQADLNLLVADFGSSLFSAKSLKIKLKQFKIEVAKGSIIESGFAAYVSANSAMEFNQVLQAANANLKK